MRFQTAFLLIVCCPFISAIASGRKGRIANGDYAEKGEFPYLASIVVNEEHICSGFIYSRTWIVTAASCVADKAAIDVKVVVGRFQLDPPDPVNEQRIQVGAIAIKNGYDGQSLANDIALIELSKSIIFNNLVNFSHYGEEESNPPTAMTAGWGAIGDGLPVSVNLKKLQVSLNADCASYATFNSSIMICAGISGVDNGSPCQYDEGSPLVQNGLIIGIVSKNQGPCGDSNFPPTVYTRLTAYYAWLRQVAGSQSKLQVGRPSFTNKR